MDKDLENIKKRIRSAGRILQLTAAQLKKLTTPEHVWAKKLRVRREKGRWGSFMAWRIQHSHVRGPYKGGLRFHPAVTLDLLRALALEMTLKAAVVALPLGGGKGGVAVDPKKLTPQELEALSRTYVRAFFARLGPYQDIPAPDVGTNEKVMAWMVSEFAKQARSQKAKGKRQKYEDREILAAFTGKPVGGGGSQGREEATGRGGLIVLQEVLRAWRGKDSAEENPSGLRRQPDGLGNRRVGGWMTIAVQGLGNVGGVFAKLAARAGFKVVAVGDSGGAVEVRSRKYELGRRGEKSKELDVRKLLKWKEERGAVAGLPGTRPITNKELLALPVDILVPAALGNVITASNAGKIKAKIILELANGPTTPAADEILKSKGVLVVPDILANAGGVTASYFEWQQNLQGGHWAKDKVNRELAKILVRAVRVTREMGEKYKVDLRTAAYLLAIKRLTVGKRLGG